MILALGMKVKILKCMKDFLFWIQWRFTGEVSGTLSYMKYAGITTENVVSYRGTPTRDGDDAYHSHSLPTYSQKQQKDINITRRGSTTSLSASVVVP